MQGLCAAAAAAVAGASSNLESLLLVGESARALKMGVIPSSRRGHQPQSLLPYPGAVAHPPVALLLVVQTVLGSWVPDSQKALTRCTLDSFAALNGWGADWSYFVGTVSGRRGTCGTGSGGSGWLQIHSPGRACFKLQLSAEIFFQSFLVLGLLLLGCQDSIFDACTARSMGTSYSSISSLGAS